MWRRENRLHPPELLVWEGGSASEGVCGGGAGRGVASTGAWRRCMSALGNEVAPHTPRPPPRSRNLIPTMREIVGDDRDNRLGPARIS